MMTYAQALLKKQRNDSSLPTLYAAMIVAYSNLLDDSDSRYYTSVRFKSNDLLEQICLTANFADRR
jgi:hypothetical protein